MVKLRIIEIITINSHIDNKCQIMRDTIEIDLAPILMIRGEMIMMKGIELDSKTIQRYNLMTKAINIITQILQTKS